MRRRRLRSRSYRGESLCRLTVSRADRVLIVSVNRARSAAQVQLISDLCDLTVPLSALGIVALDDGIVGLAGSLSSLIGIMSQWAKTA